MSYLIRGANELNGAKKDFLIRDRKIVYKGKNLDHLKSLSMNCGGFHITPSRVGVDLSIIGNEDGALCKNRFIEWQRIGCTTMLVVCPLESVQNLQELLRKTRHRMINSSVDYVIGISFPMRKLTPSFVRLCRLEKIPFIFAEIKSEEDLEGVEWPWIRNELFSYRLAIVPDTRNFPLQERALMKWKKHWKTLAAQFDIPTVVDFTEDEMFLTKEASRKIGISPFKGELRTGFDVDYNLYESTSLADPLELHYDKDSIPDVVVLRGRLMKAGKTVYYRPGFGKEVIVRVPGYLAYYPEN
ncbi:MAG TPA: hypothetical protein VFK33_04605 [Bacillales bacterium]|nr:hypothetical protein [Bacillales bacterium]